MKMSIANKLKYLVLLLMYPHIKAYRQLLWLYQQSKEGKI